MEQTHLPRPIARPRPVSLSIQVPRVKPVAELSLPKSTTGMSYNNRALSPGGRRIHNPGRLSDQTLTNPYYDQRHNSYASPRTSTAGVIPISTQTFINNPPPANTRPEQRFDSYTGRPRRSSLVDTTRATTGSTSNLPARNRPTVIQQDFARPASPQKITRDKDYYVTPASSQEPRNSTTTHKKLYSVDDGSAKLVADVNIPVQAGGERHHKRRDSIERGGYRSTGVERDRGRRQYHVNGTHNRPRDKSIDDEGAYEYTDPAAMYRDTEPRWRETRPRRGSMDRGGATSRERPLSVLDPTFGTRPAGAKEIGPPPSTRGWDKIHRGGRDEVRVAQSPTRGRTYQEPGTYGDPRDPYYVPPRTNSIDRRTTIHNYDTYEYEDRREPRRERRHSISRDARPDRSIERRGFGIRPDLRNESQTRHIARDGRGSDESIERQKYRDSGYLEQPHRRETAPDYSAHDLARMEQEKRDRELAQRVQNDDHGRPRERGYSDVRDHSKDPRRRDDGPAYGGDYERAPRDRDYERDRERERERIRQLEPPSERDRDRHHYRRDTDRDREYSRKENSPRQSGETLSKPGLGQIATGGLAGAATALGISGVLNKLSDKRDKDKDKDDYPDRDRSERNNERDRPERNSERDRPERERNNERDRPERNNERDRRNGDDRDREYDSRARERRPGVSTSDEGRERRPGQAASDEGRERTAERDRYKDPERGLGFAFEAPPEPPRSAPPSQTEWNQQYPERKADWNGNVPTNIERNQDKQAQDRNQERVGQRDFVERDREAEEKTAAMPGAFVDPDEDYRRRMEQVQRELGRTTHEQREADSDPDRERRRREREQRQRERDGRNGPAAVAGIGLDAGINEMPVHPSLRHSFDDQSTTTAPSTVDSNAGLRRKPSILDQPMTSEPVQIIDNSQSDRRENRVRIVDPPTEEEERRPRGILKKPTEKFPEDPNAVREGVAPLKDVSESTSRCVVSKVADFIQTGHQKGHPTRCKMDQDRSSSCESRSSRSRPRTIRGTS